MNILKHKNKSDPARAGTRGGLVTEAGRWDAEHEIPSDDVMLFDELVETKGAILHDGANDFWSTIGDNTVLWWYRRRA